VASRSWLHCDSEIGDADAHPRNFDVFDFSLDADDLARIAALDRKGWPDWLILRLRISEPRTSAIDASDLEILGELCRYRGESGPLDWPLVLDRHRQLFLSGTNARLVGWRAFSRYPNHQRGRVIATGGLQ
jgi:hypothetical protein